ncbi:hypothetical protein AND_001885 [Anopheles darlingi]|uniref:Lipase domain-containing protein n=1 Tax=Anopheles darlingi TaxID=43151 RepID=W5JTP7_ANODA|nr:hypothetical protein AND_001885 [Anopheles darlingi]
MRIEESLEKSNLGSYFNSSLPVKVIIHGYNANMFLSQLMKMKTEYLARGSYNLIYVDWSELASGSWYPSVVSNTPHVGTCIGQMVKRITEAGASDVHVIGFSLGAHVANYVSTTVRPLRIQRITGLDPAVNSIFGKPVDDRLDPSDADFVDVFHTNALMQGKIGTCGHADFYFNGGSVQPGCWKRDFLACNHHRALDYYAESIRSQTKFWGRSCKSYFYYAFGYCEKNLQVVAGEDCPSDARGTFMLSTNAESPFAMGR